METGVLKVKAGQVVHFVRDIAIVGEVEGPATIVILKEEEAAAGATADPIEEQMRLIVREEMSRFFREASVVLRPPATGLVFTRRKTIKDSDQSIR